MASKRLADKPTPTIGRVSLLPPDPNRIGPWLGLSDDRKVWPLDLQKGDVCIEEIAHTLSNLCRFGGRCREFYSVAQHSNLVAHIVATDLGRPDLALLGLLHDAGESLITDIPTPLKRHMGFYGRPIEAVENDILERILAFLKVPELPDDAWAVVKRADQMALATELRDLMGNPEWAREVTTEKPIVIALSGVAPHFARRAFLNAYSNLTEGVSL